MSTTLGQISFAELLAANQAETRNWRKWFDGQPASVLDVALSIASTKNVREFLLHIFAVELRYAERLQGLPVTAYEKKLALCIFSTFRASAIKTSAPSSSSRRARRESFAQASERFFCTRCCTVCATGHSWQRPCEKPVIQRIGLRIFCIAK